MKKKFDLWRRSSPTLKKLIMELKIAFFIIVISVSNIFATLTYSQVAKVSLDMESRSLEQVMDEIERQSEFYFIFNQKQIDVNRIVDIQVENKLITDILPELFKGTNVNYAVFDRKILLTTETIDNALKVLAIETEIQQTSISGTVTDASTKKPMPGVNVLVKGTTLGALTDINGKFTLTVPGNNAILVISFIGYTTKEAPVAGKSVIDIALETELTGLDEVVVIGYGTARKSDLTGSVGTASEKALQERPAASLKQSLSGIVTGVSVSSNSGRPGGKTSIRIRGNTSVSVANDPLYVVDGVILINSELTNYGSPIDYINPNDIASVEILKDASATAIYGARGANGVIMVTTKRGSQDGGHVNYNSYVSMSVLPRKLEVLNSEEYLRVEDISYNNAIKYDPLGFAAGKYKNPALNRTDPRLFDSSGNYIYDTDWQDEVTQKAFSQNHQLSFTNGDKKGSYGGYFGYTNEEGIIKISWLKRFSGRFVFDTQIKDWLKVGGSLSYNNQNERHVQGNSAGGTNAGYLGRGLLEMLPIIPNKYPDGTWGSNSDYPGTEGAPNPVLIGEDFRQYLKTLTTLGNFFTNITLAKGLELRSNVGFNGINQTTSTYAGSLLQFIGKDQKGIATIGNNQYSSWQFENYLTYTKTADISSLTGLLGVSWQYVNRFNFSAESQNYDDDFYSFNNLGAGAVRNAPTSNAQGYGLQSYFGRFNYSLSDKYLLNVSGRMDGSSKFGAANKYAFFPSAALAWRVSKEDFFQNVPVISNLKLRTSYGITGNSEISSYQSLAGMRSYSYVFNKTLVKGTGINRVANPNLKWEKTRQVDAGIELGLYKNRIAIEFDIYHKLTTNMLLNSPIPTSSGYSSVTQNIGSMVNKGIEIALNTRNVEGIDFAWRTTFNLSINKNEVTALSGGSDIFSDANIIRVGESVSTFFGLATVAPGTWSTSEEAEAAVYYRHPGDIKYLDDNKDGQINAADRVILGHGIPDGFGTLMNFFRYKNFDLMMDLQFQYGNVVMWQAYRSLRDRQVIHNTLKEVLNAWTPTNQNTPIAEIRPIAAGYDTNSDMSKMYNGSFIRGRNLLLSYTFSSEILEKLHLSNLKIYSSVQNFFLSTEFPGFDPESQTTGTSFGQGYISAHEYPKPRVFMFGLNAAF